MDNYTIYQELWLKSSYTIIMDIMWTGISRIQVVQPQLNNYTTFNTVATTPGVIATNPLLGTCVSFGCSKNKKLLHENKKFIATNTGLP